LRELTIVFLLLYFLRLREVAVKALLAVVVIWAVGLEVGLTEIHQVAFCHVLVTAVAESERVRDRVLADDSAYRQVRVESGNGLDSPMKDWVTAFCGLGVHCHLILL